MPPARARIGRVARRVEAMKPRMSRPVGRSLELQGRTTRTALAALNVWPSRYETYLLLCVEGCAPALVSRAAFVAYAAQSHVSVAERLDEPVPAGCLRTIRVNRALSLSTAVVGALRVVASTPRWTP